MEENPNYIFHALDSVSPLLEADRSRRQIQTLYLQFQEPPFEVPESGIVEDRRSMFCFAVFLPSCSKHSVS